MKVGSQGNRIVAKLTTESKHIRSATVEYYLAKQSGRTPSGGVYSRGGEIRIYRHNEVVEDPYDELILRKGSEDDVYWRRDY